MVDPVQPPLAEPDQEWGPEEGRRWLALTVGAAHRAAWRGVATEDEEGGAASMAGQDRAVALFTRSVQALYLGDDDDKALAVLVGSWATLALDEDPLGTSWQVDDLLGEPLGPVLRSTLDLRDDRPALHALWRPVRFARAIQRLQELVDRHPKFHASPGPEIFKEAKDEARQLLAAAQTPEDGPPEGLRILEDDPEEWAGERRGTHQLLRGVKVWNTLAEWLRRMQRAARALTADWTDAGRPHAPLPEGWRELVDGLAPTPPGLARALMRDLAVDEAAPTAPAEVPPGASEAERARWRSEEAWRDPSAALQRLGEAAAALDVHRRVGLLFLVDEARQAGVAWGGVRLDEPAWATEAREHLEALRADVHGLKTRAERRADATVDPEVSDKLAEVVEQLSEAAQQLDRAQTRDAEEWINLARATLDEAVSDDELAAMEAQASDHWARLRAAGRLPGDLAEHPPLAQDDADAIEALQQVASRLATLWDGVVAEVSDRCGTVRAALADVHGAQDRTLISDALDEAERALKARDLRRAVRATDLAHTRLEGVREALLERLDPTLQQVMLRARRSPLRPVERRGFDVGLVRVRDREDAGLAASGLREALIDRLDRVERDEALSGTLLGLATADGVLSPVAWWDGAVPVDPARFADAGVPDADGGSGTPHADQPGTALEVPAVEAGKLYTFEVDEGAVVRLDKLPGRRERVLPVVATDAALDDAPALPDHLARWPGRLFLEGTDGWVHGPYVVRDGALEAADARGLVGAVASRDFWDLFGALALPGFDQPERHVVDPPALDQMVAVSGRLLDRQRHEDAVRWLTGLLDAMEGVEPEAVARAMEQLESVDLPEDVRRVRLRRLERVLAVSRHLQSARAAAVSGWLHSDRGRADVEAAAARLARERTDLLDAKAEEERARLEAELDALRGEVEAARQRADQARAEAEAAEGLAEDARFALLARWGVPAAGSAPSTVSRPGPVREGGASGPSRRPGVLRPASEALVPVPSLSQLADELADTLDEDRDEVANLLLTVATSPWTLLAGPPGVGKSTRVRRLLSALGHGPASSRYLELVVRRDWQDDAALFGFWHPGGHHWEPSSEGLVERLLWADRARQEGDEGLFAVVLEEMNLASPEYYLARPLSALEDAEPRIRLYSPDTRPSNIDQYPPSVPVHDNVRWLGTVNVDDTVERLSPRFLSRTAVLWMDPSVDALLGADGRRTVPVPASGPVRWGDVVAQAHGQAPGALGSLEGVVRFLHEARMPGAPTPRALAAMRRYLAAAEGVLDPTTARDFQVLQRVLPSLRGVGSRYRDVLDGLADLLDTQGWTRAAARCRQVRRRGEDAGDYYDAFHG